MSPFSYSYNRHTNVVPSKTYLCMPSSLTIYSSTQVYIIHRTHLTMTFHGSLDQMHMPVVSISNTRMKASQPYTTHTHQYPKSHRHRRPVIVKDVKEKELGISLPGPSQRCMIVTRESGQNSASTRPSSLCTVLGITIWLHHERESDLHQAPLCTPPSIPHSIQAICCFGPAVSS